MDFQLRDLRAETIGNATVQCTVYSVQCTVYSVQCTGGKPHFLSVCINNSLVLESICQTNISRETKVNSHSFLQTSDLNGGIFDEMHSEKRG